MPSKPTGVRGVSTVVRDAREALGDAGEGVVGVLRPLKKQF